MDDKIFLPIIAVIILTLFVGGYFLATNKNTQKTSPTSTDKTQEETGSLKKDVGEIETVPQLVNCTNKETQKASQKCLDRNFSECSSAFIRVKPSEGVETKFEITGNESNGLCGVEIAFPKHPISSFSGKSMECMYDNARSFKKEVMNSGLSSSNLDEVKKALQSCSGPLADEMKRLINLQL